jgi:hypothetical protein
MGLPTLYATYNSSSSNQGTFLDDCDFYICWLIIMKLLEGIGAVSSAEGKKAASCAGNYQDAATASLDHDLDNDATTQDDGKGDQVNLADQVALLSQDQKAFCLQ